MFIFKLLGWLLTTFPSETEEAPDRYDPQREKPWETDLERDKNTDYGIYIAQKQSSEEKNLKWD